MAVLPATVEDFQRVAELHAANISQGFLSVLGVPFLKCLYQAISSAPRSAVLVAKDDKGVHGFAAATGDLSGCYRWVLGHAAFPLAICVLPRLTDIRIWQKMAETLLYPFRAARRSRDEAVRGHRAELLAIVVGEESQGRGLGKYMMGVVDGWFAGQQTSQYSVVTYALDSRSNRFYQLCGFKLARTFINHGKPMHEYHRTLSKS